MKKLVFSSLLTGFIISANAQAPANYYNGTAGLTGYTLKTKLHDIIKNHIDNGYNGLWLTYNTSDRDTTYENDGTILDIYSENPTGADPYNFNYSTDQCGNYGNEGDCYNREHIIPQSLFSEDSPMKNDAHFVVPTDGKVNGYRSNNPFGVVNSPSYTSANGSKLGPNTTPGFSGTVFEPIDEFKGDVARMVFYFATRYQDKISTFSNGDMLNGTSTQSIDTWQLNVLLAWHAADPVSQREITRNNAVYARQNNRNPFIDHPEWVNTIWGGGVVDTQAPTVPINLTATNITANTATITWTPSTDNVAVAGYSVYIDGVYYQNTISPTINLSGLQANTTYVITVLAFDAAGNNSAQSTGLSFMTNDQSTPIGGTELYFSEYVEGSSNNKVLEITNPTAHAINLSEYSIKKQSNGAGAWGSNYTLSGSIPAGETFVLSHSSAALSCPYTANATLGSYPLDFNGNDPIALFKNGTLIDAIGTYNGGSADFAANVTLRRNIATPNATFTASEWDSFPSNTCDNIGIANPTSTAGTIDYKASQEIAIYPNPIKDGILYVSGRNLEKITIAEIYSANGNLIQRIEKPFKNGNSIKLKTTIKGFYILKLDDRSIKYIIN